MTITQLGSIQAKYSVSSRRLKSHVVSILLYIPLGLIGLVWGLAVAISNPEAGYFYLCGGAGLLALALGLFSIWQWRNERDVRVTVYENGVVDKRKNGTRTATWDDVTAVRMSLVGASQRYLLEKSDGTSLSFSDPIDPISELGDTLQRQVYRRVTPQLMQRFNQGEPVSFGPFTVSQSHLQHKADSLTWNRVERVVINDGKIFVYPTEGRKSWVTGAWTNVRIGEVPNLFTFIAIVDNLVRVEQKSLVETIKRSRGSSWG